MKRFSIFLVMVALIAGLVGCASTPTQYNLTITSTEGGEVIGPGEGTFTYAEGTDVDLVAEPDEDYQFVNWTGDVNSIDDVNDATTTITMNGDYSITANFGVAYDLTISSTEGGLVTTPGEGIFTYGEGTVVNLVATPDAGCWFLNWTGDVSGIANVNDATTTITMSQACSITANFNEGETVTFTDSNLETAVREAIDIHGRPIYLADLDGLTSLNATAKNIIDLTGLEHCINLAELDLGWNQISDISPLVQNEGLGEADAVYLWGNPLSWGSINLYIPELRGRGVTVVYDEREIPGDVTVVPNGEGMMAKYTITFNITADLHSGVHSITIMFPEGTTVPQTGWQTGDITVNGHDVFGGEVTVVGTKVTFLVPQHIASGTVTVVFKEDAGIVNPPAGWYYMYVNTSRAPDATPMRIGPY